MDPNNADPNLHFNPQKNKVESKATEGFNEPLDKVPADKLHSRYFFLAIIIVFGMLLFMSLLQFFIAFLGSVIIYILTRRYMSMLVKKYHWRRSLAASVIMIISILIIMLPIAILGFMLYSKGKFYITHPEMMVAGLKKVQQQLQDNYNLTILSDENIATVKQYGAGLIKTLLNESMNFFVSFSILYFFLYFMLVGFGRLEASIVFFLPFKRNKIEIFGKELIALTYSNAVGVPAIAVAQGVVAYIAYLIAGLPEPGFWAVVTAFTSILPIVGTGLVWLPLAIYLFMIHHTWQGIFIAAWGLLVLGITDNVVRFILAKKMADIHPICTVLGVVMGLKLFGITGLIFGPVLISFFVILLKLYYFEYQRNTEMVPAKNKTRIQYNLPFLAYRLKRKPPTYAATKGKRQAFGE